MTAEIGKYKMYFFATNIFPYMKIPNHVFMCVSKCHVIAQCICQLYSGSGDGKSP